MMSDVTEDTAGCARFPAGKRVGYNVDPVDVSTGLGVLESLGWSPETDSRTFMVIQYALQRWGRGEEEQAERLALGRDERDPLFKAAAIDLTSWRMVLASAIAEGTSRLAVCKEADR